MTYLSNWSNHLKKAEKALRKLNGSSEDEFIILGERVQQFYFKAKEISNTSDSVANQLTGDEILSTTDGLQKLLDDMNDNLKQSEDLVKYGEIGLPKIVDEIEQVHKSLNGFEKIVRTLYILGISTRIENASSNADQDDFNILSEKVRNLADLIQSKSATIAAHSKSLNQSIQTTLADIIDLKQQHYERTGLILEKTRSNLNALSTKQRVSAGTIQNVSRTSEKIYKQISGVISSMQFRDITRQQLEHVAEALDELSLDLGANLTKEASGTEQNDLIYRTSDICDLQKAQVQQAKQSLLSAVNQIFSNLRGISVSTNHFAGEVKQLAGASDDNEESFLSDIGSDISEISESLSKNAKTGKAMVSSIRSVAGTVAEMSKFLRDIESIGMEIEMIALNAVVKASQIGKSGAALSILAESIKELSSQTKNQIDTISKALKKVSSSADQISDHTKNLSTKADSKSKSTLKEIGDLLTTLDNLNKDIISALQNLNHEAKTLAWDVESGIAQFKIHNVFANLLQRVWQALDEITNEADVLVPNRSRSEQESSLKTLETRYTMASERAVHQSLNQSRNARDEVASALELQGQDAIDAMVADDDDLGDNVELF